MPAASRCSRMGTGASRPVRIAHGFGNSRRRLARALEGPVDLLETDVWFENGRTIVRHERKLRRLPILFDKKPESAGERGPGRFGISLGKWYIKLDTSVLPLREVMARSKGRRGLLLDLKGAYRGEEVAFAGALVELVASTGMEHEVAFCGQNWRLLKRVRRLAPHLAVHYSIDNTAQLAAFRRMQEGDPIRRICLRQSLLDESLAHSLQALGVTTVYTWTVDDLRRAQELLELGVEGIISNSLELLGLLGPEADAHLAEGPP